jgi:hypothetical protein
MCFSVHGAPLPLRLLSRTVAHLSSINAIIVCLGKPKLPRLCMLIAFPVLLSARRIRNR